MDPNKKQEHQRVYSQLQDQKAKELKILQNLTNSFKVQRKMKRKQMKLLEEKKCEALKQSTAQQEELENFSRRLKEALN